MSLSEAMRGTTMYNGIPCANNLIMQCNYIVYVAYRKGIGTTDMIWALRLVIEKHCEYNQPPFIVFLDLEKAFDRVPREKLWMAMAEYMVLADQQIAIKHIQNQQEQSEHKHRKWGMGYHRIRCSPRKHTITYIVRNVHGPGDQGSTSKQPRK